MLLWYVDGFSFEIAYPVKSVLFDFSESNKWEGFAHTFLSNPRHLLNDAEVNVFNAWSDDIVCIRVNPYVSKGSGNAMARVKSQLIEIIKKKRNVIKQLSLHTYMWERDRGL